ncbi:MAG TPA: hypothetical protein VGG27_04370 [Magnetospirillaceae bacterium]|jgi:hypothetical protein
MKIAFTGAALCALAACAADKPAALGPSVNNDMTAPALTSDQIRKLVVGNTGTGPISGSHINLTIYVSPDGTALADLPTGIDHGMWHLTADGQVCWKWDSYRAGQEYCQHVYQSGPDYRFVNSTMEEHFIFTPGKHIEA